MSLSRAQILQAKDIATESVVVPEWGDVVLVRGLTGRERDQYEGAMVRMYGTHATLNRDNFRARLVVLAAVDDQGERLFSDADIPALAEKSSSALSRLFDVAARLSGITESDIGELEKNSVSSQGVGNGST